MKKLIIYTTVIAILSFLFYHLTISFLPNAIYGLLKFKIENQRGAIENQLAYLPLPNDNSRAVVKPNPDFLYVSSFYDVSEGPLHLTGTLPDSTYWSVAFYYPNTVNWYVKNDMEYGANRLDLILAKEGSKKEGFEQKEWAFSKKDKGFLLIRILVTDSDSTVVERFEEWQKSVKLESLP